MSQDFDDSEGTSEERVTFRGPANWFSFELPETLELEQTEAFLEIKPRTTNTSRLHDTAFLADQQAAGAVEQAAPQWSMTMYAAWVDHSEPETMASSFNAASLFPGVVNSCHERPLELPGRCRAWSGVSKDVASGSWWKKLLRRRRVYDWRLWIVEYQEIMIVASLQTRPGATLGSASLTECEETLNSILFAETLARPPALFRQDVVDMGKKHFPLLEIAPAGSFGVSIAGSEINLSNFYRSYIHHPEKMKEIVLPGLTTIVRLQGLSPEQLMPELAEVSDRVMPMLYPQDEADTTMSEFVQVSWVGGLSVLFVLDEDESYRFVHRRMLDRWKISTEELQELAMRNLAVFADDNPLEVSLFGGDEDARMLVPFKPSPYNSVRLLGQHLHGRLRQLLGAELVVGVPNRDYFVAVSLNHPELIGQVQQKVAQDYQSMHHPLTSRLLVISADGVSEYCES